MSFRIVDKNGFTSGKEQFLSRNESEELLDTEYLISLGGWNFIKSITPFFLRESRLALREIIFCSEESNIKGVTHGLHKLMGAANSIGAMKIVRSILVLQLMIDEDEKNLSDPIEQMIDQFNELEKLLNSEGLYQLLSTQNAS